MILICYDGSPDAKAAIEQAGELLQGQPAVVLTVWQPFAQLLARSPSGIGPVAGVTDIEEIDESSRKIAQQRAEEGAALAREAGFDAQPRSCSQASTTARTILATAEDVLASAIVMGSRGLTGLKSLLLGSVSHAVTQHANLPVLVVPSAEVAQSRTRGHAVPGSA